MYHRKENKHNIQSKIQVIALGGNMKNRKWFMKLFLGEINLFCFLWAEANTIAKKKDSFYLEYEISRVQNIEEEISHGSNLPILIWFYRKVKLNWN